MPRINSDVTCRKRSEWCPVSRWRDENIGSSTERGNLDFHVKGNVQVENLQGKSTEGKARGGRTRSSDENSVMEWERRGSSVSLLN